MIYFILHKVTTPQECGFCGRIIPPGNDAEYWRVKGSDRDGEVDDAICCFCHTAFGLPAGWAKTAGEQHTMAS